MIFGLTKFYNLRMSQRETKPKLLIPGEMLGRIGNLQEAIVRKIPVETLIGKYAVEATKTLEAIRSYPVLAYLLGKVSDEPEEHERIDEGPKKGVREKVHVLKEGSGMFGLSHKEDAALWKGIFNHIVGSARIIHNTIEAFQKLTPEQRLEFEKLGFDFSLLDQFTPELGASYMLVNHAGRRRMDEHNWYGFIEAPHLFDDSFPNTLVLLAENNAHPALLALMNEENHNHLIRVGKEGIYSDALLSIMLAGDWQWGQELTDLHKRFEQMRASGRLPPEMFDALEKPIIPFMNAVTNILGENFWQKMADPNGPFKKHEVLIREGYAASSGLSVAELFPAFAQVT